MERAAEIYFAPTAALLDGRVFEEKLLLVNEQRREKVLCCKQTADRIRTLAAGLLIRYGLEQKGIAYEDADFALDRFGKPYLLSAPKLHFNVSHSGEYAACAISHQEIGIDMEGISERFEGEKGKKRMDRVADRIFSDREKCYLERCSEGERAEVFVKLWTRKECYAKAYGEGIRMDFSKIDTLKEDHFFSRRIGDYWLSVCGRTESPQKMGKAFVTLEEVGL